MAAAEAALSGGDGGRHVGAWRFPCVIASAASKRVGSPDTFDWVIARGFSLVAIKHVGILCLLIATLALLARNDTMSATKVAPSKYFLVIASEAKQSTVYECPTRLIAARLAPLATTQCHSEPALQVKNLVL